MQAEPIVHVDNERVRVTEWRFAEGAHTGHHRHPLEYVIVPLADGVLRITLPDGTVSDVPLARGQSYYRPAGVEHDVQSVGPGAFAFVEVEMKG